MFNPFKKCFNVALATSFTLFGLGLFQAAIHTPEAHAIFVLSNTTIDRAVEYGLRNQNEGLSTFMGGNWREGQDGTLLNVYTPWMNLARSAAHRHMSAEATPEVIKETRKKMIQDIDYIWHHPEVKFMVSMNGDSKEFARQYFARVEGVGHGRTYRVYPTKTRVQYTAELEPNAPVKPYTGINSYTFDFTTLASMDEINLILYGKGVEPIIFKMRGSDIQ